MAASRTAKTLVVLLGAMTFGSITLWLVSGEPIPPAGRAAATHSTLDLNDTVFNTQAPLRPARWRHIVIHSAASRFADLPSRCHFILDQDGKLDATARWKRQMHGQGVSSVARSFNSESISICLLGDFTQDRPPDAQFEILTALTRLLQDEPFYIGPGHVYLRSDLDAFSDCPGLAFPAEEFTAQLHRPGR